jgi:hypothetical protein
MMLALSHGGAAPCGEKSYSHSHLAVLQNKPNFHRILRKSAGQGEPGYIVGLPKAKPPKRMRA